MGSPGISTSVSAMATWPMLESAALLTERPASPTSLIADKTTLDVNVLSYGEMDGRWMPGLLLWLEHINTVTVAVRA